MTRPTDAKRCTPKRRTRRRFASITGLVALLGALLVTVAAPARAALSNCSDPQFCPLANDDDYTASFGKALSIPATIGLLANDQGTPGTHVLTDSLDTDNQSFPGGATVHVKADGSFTYTPNPASFGGPFSGDDSFSYTIANLNDTSEDFATVYIHVPGIARNDTYGTGINKQLTVDEAHGVMANDTGLDPSSITIPTETQQHGTLTDNGNGAFAYTPPTGFVGADTFQYDAWDYDIDNDYKATVTIYVDGTPPTVSMSAPPLVTLGTKVTGQWSGTDDQGVANYDAQYDVAPWNGGFGPWATLRSATTATSATVAGTYGRTFCIRARARDHAGNVSPFATPRCSAVPLRSTSLTYSAKWARKDNAAYFGGTAYVTPYQGQNVTMPGVQAKRMWLVATKCSTCGTLNVRWNNVVISHINLASPITVRHALLAIPPFTAVRTGTVRFDVTSPNGKQVIVEGLAVLRA